MIHKWKSRRYRSLSRMSPRWFIAGFDATRLILYIRQKFLQSLHISNKYQLSLSAKFFWRFLQCFSASSKLFLPVRVTFANNFSLKCKHSKKQIKQTNHLCSESSKFTSYMQHLRQHPLCAGMTVNSTFAPVYTC